MSVYVYFPIDSFPSYNYLNLSSAQHIGRWCSVHGMRMVRFIFGTMEMGRKASYEESIEVIKSYQKYCMKTGTAMEIDTDHMYADGKSEEIIGDCQVLYNNCIVASKANPWKGLSLSGNDVRRQLNESLARMKTNKIDIFYLHGPDQSVPLEHTLEGVNDLFNEGKFKEFGVSNFPAWQLTEIVNICKSRNWILPTVYQGMYNPLKRKVEDELIPCLRYFGIRFYAYSPLAGGILADKYLYDDAFDSNNTNGRFFGSGAMKDSNRNHFWRKEYFDICAKLKLVLKMEYPNEIVSLPEGTLRWLHHHSILKHNDGIILGASSCQQLNNNLKYVEADSLSHVTVEAFNNAWSSVMELQPRYYST